MRLKIELVPKSAWNTNLRSILKKNDWDKVRKFSYKKARYRCDICGRKTVKPQCHEVWQYDDKHNIQKLVKLESLCSTCHSCKHMGFAFKRYYEGKLDIERIINHFTNINKISMEEFSEYVKKTFEQWENRSKEKWKLDISYLKKYCKKYNINLKQHDKRK